MQNLDRNFIVMGLLLGVAGLLSVGIYLTDFKQTDTVQIRDFPRTIGTWAVSEDIPLSKQELAILETDNAFIRKYTNTNGESVYLYIVYSQTNHKATHPPEICYTGGGISILEKVHDAITVGDKGRTINTNRLLLQDKQLYQVSFYWFKVGDVFTPNYWKEQMLVLCNTLLGQRKGSALIRVSADLINNDQKKAIKEVKEFVNLVTPQLFKYLP